jgi:CheY-like chemotaxis protein
MSAREGMTILVVDDEPDLLELVRMVLKGDGHEVIVAANGREALTIVDEHTPNLILLDMRMPVMNGWEFAAELKTRQAPVPSIVVMTAAEDAAARASEIGAAGFIGKPFNIRVLLDEVRRQLT